MIRRTFVGVCFSLVFFLGGCANAPVALKPETCAPSPCKVLAVGYSTTPFQARFIGKTFGRNYGLIGGAISASLVDYDKMTGERLAANEFEKRLGSFDTAEYFFRGFPAQLPGSTLVSFDFAENPDSRIAVLSSVRAATPAANITDAATGKTYENVAAFRLFYGLGMRVGTEQVGFRKTYRPFIRIIGVVRNLPGNKIIWRDSAIAFGETKYVGDNADAVNIDPAELIDAFKKLGPEAIALLAKSLNGAVLEGMPELYELSPEDFNF